MWLSKRKLAGNVKGEIELAVSNNVNQSCIRKRRAHFLNQIKEYFQIIRGRTLSKNNKLFSSGMDILGTMEEEHSFADLNYETGSYSLMEIIQKFPLPVVVFCDASNSALPVDRTRFNLDLRQPLLLYRNRNIRKVSARSVHIDPSTRTFQDVGEPLLIPEDYKGIVHKLYIVCPFLIIFLCMSVRRRKQFLV